MPYKKMLEVEVKFELDLNPASEEILKWAEKNINEDPDLKYQVLEDFKDLIYSRGECTPHRLDDKFLLRFLRSRKYHLEAAHKLLANYCDLREENPHFVNGVGFKLLDKIGNCDLISVPPYRDQNGKRILMYKLGKWDIEKVSMDEILSATLLIIELAIMEDKAQIFGGICIIDCEGISMQHALQMSNSIAYKIFQVAAIAHPMRLEAMHILNSSWMFEKFFYLFKPFLHGKMKERLFLHGDNMDSFHKHVDPKCLPTLYGGTQPHHNYKHWLEWFPQNKEVLDDLKLQGYTVP